MLKNGKKCVNFILSIVKPQNFAEALMYKVQPNITDSNVITVDAIGNDLQVKIDGQPSSIKLYYAILCTVPFDEWCTMASEFPWIKIVTLESVCKLLSPSIVDVLASNW